jgi:hypothetical protein
MSATRIHAEISQHQIVRDAPSASAIIQEIHRLDLGSRTTIETRLDEVIACAAMGNDTSAVAPTYVDIDGIGDPDDDTGLREITVESSTGSGDVTVIIWGRRGV